MNKIRYLQGREESCGFYLGGDYESCVFYVGGQERTIAAQLYPEDGGMLLLNTGVWFRAAQCHKIWAHNMTT